MSVEGIEFEAWPKTPRLNRDIIITEKIDGTNSAVIVKEGLWVADPEAHGAVASFEYEDTAFTVGAQSRNRLIFPGKTTDNYGFAGWVREHAVELAVVLGDGRHFGEWWGQGIARRYDQDRKRFSLFNVDRYGKLLAANGTVDGVDTVPVLYRGPFSEPAINDAVLDLVNDGSLAAPDFMDPEGVIVFHSASRQVFKVLLENDDLPKGLVA